MPQSCPTCSLNLRFLSRATLPDGSIQTQLAVDYDPKAPNPRARVADLRLYSNLPDLRLLNVEAGTALTTAGKTLYVDPKGATPWLEVAPRTYKTLALSYANHRQAFEPGLLATFTFAHSPASTSLFQIVRRAETFAPEAADRALALEPFDRAVVLTSASGATPSPVSQRWQLSSATDDAHYPAVAATGSGDIWVFWSTNNSLDIVYRQYINAERRWTSSALLYRSPRADWSVNDLAAVADGDGSPWLFWSGWNASAGDVCFNYLRKNVQSGQWEDPGCMVRGLASNPRAIVDSFGDLWVLWQSGSSRYTSFVKQYDHVSGLWGTDLALGQSYSYKDPQGKLVADRDGGVWYLTDNLAPMPNKAVFRRFRRTSGQWDPVSELAPESTYSMMGAAAVEKDGDLLVVYNGAAPSWRRWSRATDSWTPPAPLSFIFTADLRPAAAVGENGDVWLVGRGLGGTFPLRYDRFRHDVSSWDPPRDLSLEGQFLPGVEHIPIVVVDPSGPIRVFWRAPLSSSGNLGGVFHQKIEPAL